MAYVAGYTVSPLFPVTDGAFQTTHGGGGGGGGGWDAFVAKINPFAVVAEDSLLYATYLGGGGMEIARGIAIAPWCAADCPIYLTGRQNSNNFPVLPPATPGDTTTGAFQVLHAGNTFMTVMDVSSDGDPVDDIVYSTLFAGKEGMGIAVDQEGRVHIVGIVSGSKPTKDSDPLELLGGGDAFVAVFNPTKNGLEDLLFAGYVSGSSVDRPDGIAVDSESNTYIAGTTRSEDFPVTQGAFQTNLFKNGRSSRTTPPADAFVTKISSDSLVGGVLDPNENFAPVVVDDAYTTIDGTPLIVDASEGMLANDYDPNPVPVTLTLGSVTDPGGGDLSLNADGSFTYTPDADFIGMDGFTYSARAIGERPWLLSPVAKVTIEVTEGIGPPTAVNDGYFVKMNETLAVNPPDGVLSNDIDTEGAGLAAVLDLENGPYNATGFTFNSIDGSFTYSPDLGFEGVDQSRYQAATNTDPQVTSDPATVTITVHDVTVHVSDLHPIGGGSGRFWTAYVQIYFHDGSDKSDPDGPAGPLRPVVYGVTSIEGTWSVSATETPSICWGGIEYCQIALKDIPKKFSSVTFQVGNVTHNTRDYEPNKNEAVTVTVFKP